MISNNIDMMKVDVFWAMLAFFANIFWSIFFFTSCLFDFAVLVFLVQKRILIFSSGFELGSITREPPFPIEKVGSGEERWIRKGRTKQVKF